MLEIISLFKKYNKSKNKELNIVHDFLDNFGIGFYEDPKKGYWLLLNNKKIYFSYSKKEVILVKQFLINPNKVLKNT